MLLTLLQHHQLGAQIQDGLLGRVLGLCGAASKPTPHLERYVMVLKSVDKGCFQVQSRKTSSLDIVTVMVLVVPVVDGGVISNKTNDSIARWK